MAIKKTSYIKLIILVSLFNIGFTNLIVASHELGNARLSGSNIAVNNVLFIQDNKYPVIATMPSISTWGFYDVAFKNKIILGIDRYNTGEFGDFTATVQVEITSVLPQALGGTSSVSIQSLSVSYEGFNDHQSSAPHVSSDEQDFTFTNGYATYFRIISVVVTSSSGTTYTMPGNVYLQAETDAERYYQLPQNASPFFNSNDVTINYIAASDEYEISWARINGAESYDLEWLWLDAYNTGTWGTNPEIDFRHNSTRIRTSQQSYRVSNIFEEGQVLFRIRGVGKSGLMINTYDKDAYTPWSWQDLTTLGSALPTGGTYITTAAPSTGNDFLFYISVNGPASVSQPKIHESNKNWQYKGTYAEEGKKKEVISYFDGSLRNRQMVTKNNSDKNAIVGETYYDYNGRAAVQALPVPVADATIKFYQYNVSGKSGFNVDIASGLPYDKSGFDVDAATNPSSVCAVTANGLDPNYGSSYYYSPNNINQQMAQGYVPDAELFPISQTEFTNDNTGRVAKQGGVGKNHQLGSQHETKYFYSSPEQIELDRLFGSEVGYSKHYKKNMVVDANGQVSISYLDQEGRTIATALSGQTPNNLQALVDKNGNPLYAPPTATNVINADLLNKAHLTDFDTNVDNNVRTGDELTFSKKISVPTAATYTISYDLQGTSYTYNCLPAGACYDCVYDLEINVFDNCLNNPPGFTKITKTLGNIMPPASPTGSASPSYTLDALCNAVVSFSTSQLDYSGHDLLVDLQQGDYYITKTLKINTDAMSFYLNDYLKSNCVKTIDDFKDGIAPDTSGCSLTCDECIAALGTQADYVAAHKGSNEDWLAEYMVCKEPCEYVSMCDAEYLTMLADVSPGGQYGEWEDNNGGCDPSLYDLSVYNEANKLPAVKNFNLGHLPPDWRHPWHRNNAYPSVNLTNFTSTYYDDDNATIASGVIVTRVINPSSPTIPLYFPPIVSSAIPVPVTSGNTNIGDQFTVKPQELANVADFISNWKNSWAPSLVFYHPEYAYYDWCLKNSTSSISSPYTVSLTSGTVVTTGTVSTSDSYDSLLLVTDDITNVSLTDLNKFTLCLSNDPYWSTNGLYYNNGLYPTSTSATGAFQLSTTGALFPWNVLYQSATTRFNNYQNSGATLPIFAALITTSCSIQFGQPISAQLACLNTGYSITSGMTAEQIINTLPTAVLKNKYWDNYRMMYLSFKQQLQQESAESYAMNGDYRGCNDGIGDPSFDPMAMKVPFTQYAIFGPTFYSFPGTSFITNFFNQWFFPFATANEPQYCNLFTGPMYNSKIKRFPNAKSATDLANNMSNGDPGASIYASTGLCPNAFYFQNLLNSLGANNELTSATLNLSTIPEFNQNLYTVVANGVIPTTFTPANWTATNSSNVLNASMQIGTNSPCALTLNFPTGYPFDFSNTGNGGTYSFLKIYHLVPGTSTGGSFNFTIAADVALTSGSSTTFTTVTLNGSTCIPLTGCTFTPPCEPTTAAILMQKLLNAIAATGNMCSSSVLMSDPSIQPYFLNSFGAILGVGNWEWQINGAIPNFIIKDIGGTSTNNLTISFASNPCTSGGTFAFANITGNNTSTNSFNIGINTIPSGGGSVLTTTTTGTVLLNGQPIKMGSCGFDNAKCNTIPHQTREEMEAFLLKSATRGLLQASSTDFTSIFNFGFNLRNQLAGNYQTFVGTSPSVTTNTLYYYWQNTTPAVSSATLLTGSFYATSVTPMPSAPPQSACSFSLQFADPTTVPLGTSLASPSAYTLSNFTLAAGPMVNTSVYDFSVTATFGSSSYVLLGSSSCFAMRSCGECVSSTGSGNGDPVSESMINSFPCEEAPTFTLGYSGGTYTVISTGKCDSEITLNEGEAIVSSSSSFSTFGGPYPSYDGSSLYLFNNVSNSLNEYHQNYTPNASCESSQMKMIVWDARGATIGNPYLTSDFTVKVNGVTLSSTSSSVSLGGGWTQFTYGNFAISAGTPFSLEIFFTGSGDRYIIMDQIKLSPVRCFTKIDPIPCVSIDTIAPMPEIPYEDPCVQYALDIADNDAQELYNAYIDSMKTAFVEGYIQKCMGNAVENMYMKYNAGDYHYTLYYYDQAGNLVRTVPPQGVITVTNTAQLALILTDRVHNEPYATKHYYTVHTLETTYAYNSLNQLVKQETPDAGISYFWYDALGRLVASQNAKQRAKTFHSNNYYSYTRYDYLGRIAEVGEMNIAYDFVSSSPATVASLINPLTNDYPTNLTPVKTEITRTYYGDDASFTPLIAGSNFTSGSQDYLRSRVASVTIEDADDGITTTYNHGTHYSYDVHGNVKELIQENQDMPIANQVMKKVNYTYDLISGKVNTVAYQPGAADMFLHRYEYDADNRITNVYTSRDNVIWDQDAKYFYYLHGPLARVEVGNHKVQGVDYAYTIQGWVKGVNSNMLDSYLDIGKDAYKLTSTTSSLNNHIGKDIFSYSLTYYRDNKGIVKDYTAINGITGVISDDFIADASGIMESPDLFNGNIRQMVTSYADAGAPGRTYNLSTLLKNFRYDQLNRIVTADATDVLAGNQWDVASISGMYDEKFSYDENGNILHVSRDANQSGSLSMDDLDYLYLPNTNKLDYVKDGITGDPYTGDIDPGQGPGNYAYDENGNLIQDNSEGISTIEWTIYGKIKTITKTSTDVISFKYDANGNRISKTFNDNAHHNHITTYYVRDAQGNTMAVYGLKTDREGLMTYSLNEHHMYGSSRLGLDMRPIDPSVLNFSYNYYTRDLGSKNYELDNHLGNVITTISDRKIAADINHDGNIDYFTGEVLNATDYYSFGSPMPGRNFSNGNYRFGFNSQEKDDEITGNIGTHTNAKFWEYDTRLGKRWNIDHVVKVWLSGYSCFSNSPIWKMDTDGNDDYYNYAGKYIGSDGATTTNIRLVSSKQAFEGYQKQGVETLQSRTRLVTIQENTDQAIDDIYTNSVNNKIEQKAYIVLDTKKATLTIEVQPQSPEDKVNESKNTYDVHKRGGDEYKSPVGDDGNKVIVGQIHGHPGKELGRNVIPGPSTGDVQAAKDLGTPVYPVDKETIYKVDQNGTKSAGACKDECAPILQDALETSGGKPQ